MGTGVGTLITPISVLLTTVDNVKKLLKSPVDSSLDALILDLIESYSKAAAVYCLREFNNDRVEEYFDGGTQLLFLSRKPVTSIIGIWVDDNWEWNDEDLISAKNYRLLDADNGMVQYKLGYWSSGGVKGEVKVIYYGGFSVIPEDLEMAIRTQVAYKVKRRDDVGLTAVGFPDGQIQKRIVDEFLPEVKAVLDRYTPMYIG